MKKAVGRNSRTAAKKVGEWCKEHWKAAITIVIVIAAVILVASETRETGVHARKRQRRRTGRRSRL